MFNVYKMKEIKEKKNPYKIINTPKKTNIFTKIISSPLKPEEKSSPSHNSFSFITNNSSDSGKALSSCLLNEKQTMGNKNLFLSKKTKFAVDFIDKEKEIKKISNEPK